MTYILIIIFVILIIVIPLIQGYLIRRRLKGAGYIVITEDENGKKLFSLELNMNPDVIQEMKYVIFRVVNEPSEELE